MRWLKKCPLFTLCVACLILLAALQAALPARERSEWENRPLATLDAPSWASVLSGRWMDAAEKVVADQLPARDGWMKVNALWETAMLRTERNGVLLGARGRRFEACAEAALNRQTAEANLAALEALAAQTGLPVRLLLAPMSSAVCPEALPWRYPAANQEEWLAALYARASRVRPVDVLPAMRKLDGDALYYRLDHHWTAEGARVAYEALAALWGQPVAMPSETLRAEPFYGSYFARAPAPFCQPDTLTFDVYGDVTLRIGEEVKPLLYSPEALEGRDKYAALLWGNHGALVLENADAPPGTLLVLKDSYANALLPALAQHFSRVVAVDLRYFTGNVTELAMEVDEILCLYGVTSFVSDRNLAVHGIDWCV